MDCALFCWLPPAIIGQVIGFLLGLLSEHARMRRRVSLLNREIKLMSSRLSKLEGMLEAADDPGLYGAAPDDESTAVGAAADDMGAVPDRFLGSLSPGHPIPSLAVGAMLDHTVRLVEATSSKVARESVHERYISDVEGSKGSNEALFNEAARHLWPYISKYVETLLREEVQPALQSALPEVLSGVRFTEKCHLGDQAPIFESIECLKVERGYRQDDPCGSRYREASLRLVAEVALAGNCEIELEIPMEFPMMNVERLEPRLGVSDLRLRGTLVVELSHLLEDLPLIGGIQVFFVNPPELDLKLTGAIGWMQHVGVIKRMLVDAILKQLGTVLVLPKRVASPFADEVDVFQLLTPMPEGILRLEVKAVSKANERDEQSDEQANVGTRIHDVALRLIDGSMPSPRLAPVYIRVVSGSGGYRTPSARLTDGGVALWDVDNTFDFTVHDRVAQKFMVSLHCEGHSWMLGHTHDCLAYSEVSAQAIVESMHNDLTIRMSAMLSESPNADHEPEDILVTFGKDWRSFTRWEIPDQMPIAAQSSWRLHRHTLVGRTRVLDDDDDINCKLLVGFYGAQNLPSEELTYWCKVTCTNVRTFGDGEKINAPMKHKVKETARVQGELCSKWQHSTRGSWRLGSQSNMSGARAMVRVVWEQPKFFHFSDTKGAELTVELFCSDQKKCLGYITFQPSSLLECDDFAQIVDRKLTGFPPGLTHTPSVRIVFQLWVLKSQGHCHEGVAVPARSGHQVVGLASFQEANWANLVSV